MSFPVHNNNFLNIAAAGSIAAGESFPKGNPFDAILRESLDKAGISSTDGPAIPALSRDQIEFLVKNIQIQMNRHLFNIVFNNGGETGYSPSIAMPAYTGGKKDFSPDVSKNRQEPPKNEVSRSNESNAGNADYHAVITKAARIYDLDPDLIRSVIKTESNFDPKATSPKGAMGLMQLMPSTARDLGVKNAYDAEENIMGGSRYLKSLLDRYDGKVNLALAAYNWGMGNVERKPHGLPEETVNYIDRVNKYLKSMKA